MIRRPPRSTQSRSSAASDVYKRQLMVLLTRRSGSRRTRDVRCAIADRKIWTLLIADTRFRFADKGSRSRGRRCPSFALQVPPFTKEGAGNAGCPMHPQPGVRILVVSMHTSIHSEAPESSRHPPRNGFTAYSALSPGTTALLTPSSARRVGVLRT